MSAFHRLHPNLRHAIVHDLGWRSLRPVQERAIDAVLDGENAVVLAPTAGGKTEASIFPVLSRILTERIEPVAALYVCPIRALLNNQEERIQRYARMVGLDAFKWHGDVAASAKVRVRRDPAHVLLTTPESIEVMLISEKTDARRLFAGLSVVIIDEVHAVAGDQRGAHLTSLLERLTRFCGRDVQRIGLSATVGNPEEIGRWLQGSSKRPFRLVDPPRERGERDFRVDYLADVDMAAEAAARAGRFKKSLVFVESRSQAERVAAAMSGHGTEVFVHHSAISRSDRARAEEQFSNGRNTAIVCTATLELGIDVGDLDQVIQIDAPSTVSALMQRMGRTGRRPSSRSNCTFLCVSPESVVQATAMVRLARRGWIEDVRPLRASYHVLAHQILALTLQEGGVSRHRVRSWFEGAASFADVSDAALQRIVDTMVEREILHEGDGLLSLGTRGEKLFGAKHFFELYAVFSSPRVLRVVHRGAEIGTVQATFLNALHDEKRGLCFRLAGRAWSVVRTDWSRGVCEVEPAATGRVPSWLGTPQGLSHDVCQEMRSVLADTTDDSALTRPARQCLAELRGGYEGLVEDGGAPMEVSDDGTTWHTFAGASINRTLAAALHVVGGGEWTAGNLSVRTSEALPAAGVSSLVERLRTADWAQRALQEALDGAAAPESKFDPCIPDEFIAESRRLALVDLKGAKTFVGSVRVGIAVGRRA
ncbi:MAG: DEAD/DEAH box helicase [Polyangiales bacterium]